MFLVNFNFKTSISFRLKIICSLCLPEGVFCHFEEWEFDNLTRNKNSFLSLGEKCCPKIYQLSFQRKNQQDQQILTFKTLFSLIPRSSVVVIWKSTDFKSDFLLLRSFLHYSLFLLCFCTLTLYFDIWDLKLFEYNYYDVWVEILSTYIKCFQ